MRHLLLGILLLSFNPSFSQYYLRGEIRDGLDRPVQGVKIRLHSTGEYPYYSGSAGAFGIPSRLQKDSIICNVQGFEELRSAVAANEYTVLRLKSTSAVQTTTHLRLSSLTKDLLGQRTYHPSVMGESYSNTVENDVLQTKDFPQTGYSINVDRACYSNIRRFLNNKGKPPIDAVRIEEMLNYFNFRNPNQAPPVETFSANTAVTSCPWNPNSKLLFVNLQAASVNLDKTPPSNLVFLIDASGSMDMPNRLPLLQSAFKLLVENLRSKDTVSIITYGGTVAVVLQPTSGSDKLKIIQAIESLKPSGSTPGESAIRVAYEFARRTYIKGGNNRVILATDGDFNVGQTTETELEYLITQQTKSGIFLTCLGVGMGNYKDSKLEALAKRGNGNFAYIDNEHEGEKVLVEEFAQTLYTVASDAYVTLQFNANFVKAYRLIGFDNKQSALDDAGSILEGGEVGSGQSLLSVFEITPGDEYQSDTIGTLNKSVAKIKLHYTLPGSKQKQTQLIEARYNYKNLSEADSCLRFASAIIMWGSLLKQSKHLKNMLWDDVYAIAFSAADASNPLQLEFLEMIQKTRKIYGNNRKKW